MSQKFPIVAAQNNRVGVMFGTSNSDNSQGESVDVVSGAAKVNLAGGAGYDPTLDAFSFVSGGTEYVQGPGVTSAADITIQQSVGAIGDLLQAITIYNGSASNITAIVIKDGTTALDFVVPAAIAAGASATIPLFGGDGVQSKNGPWKLNLTCAGTMSAIKWGAKGKFS